MVPLKLYPAGYHTGKSVPLPYASLASQKGHMSLYLFGCYMEPKDAARLTREFKARGKKLDMGKSCVRFKTLEDLPLDVIGEGTVPLDGEKRAWKLGAQTDWTIGARPARGRLEAARAGLARLDEERTFARDRVDADVLDAASALDAARARLGVVSTLTGVAARVAEAERARFAIGDSNLIFVNQREIAVAEAELLVIDATLAACRGWVDWLAAQGVLGE